MQVTSLRGGSIVRPQIIFTKSILRSSGLDLQLLHNTYSYHDILIRFHRIYQFFYWIERSAVSENEKGRITSLIVLISFWGSQYAPSVGTLSNGLHSSRKGKTSPPSSCIESSYTLFNLHSHPKWGEAFLCQEWGQKYSKGMFWRTIKESGYNQLTGEDNQRPVIKRCIIKSVIAGERISREGIIPPPPTLVIQSFPRRASASSR